MESSLSLQSNIACSGRKNSNLLQGIYSRSEWGLLLPFTSRLSNIISILAGMIRWSSSVQIAVQFAILQERLADGTGTIDGGEEQKGLSHRLATVGLVRRGGPKVSPRAFLSIFLSIDLPPAIGRTR